VISGALATLMTSGMEGADQKLGAVVDQLFGVLAGGVDV
jgi:hypothetical protein